MKCKALQVRLTSQAVHTMASAEVHNVTADQVEKVALLNEVQSPTGKIDKPGCTRHGVCCNVTGQVEKAVLLNEVQSPTGKSDKPGCTHNVKCTTLQVKLISASWKSCSA